MSKVIGSLSISNRCELTTNHPASSYGIPVLAFHSSGRGFGPSDRVVSNKFNALWPGDRGTAAYAVYGWAINNELTAQELEFVKSYLGQWPEGPQID